MINNKQQQRISIDVNTLKSLACPICTNTIFHTNINLFKKLPAIQSPTGQEQMIAIALAECRVCKNFFQVKSDGLTLITIESPEEYEVLK